MSGSVAAYRAADLARELMRRGANVRVCLTDAASQFVTPALFEALTGQPCLSGVFEEPEPGRMAHIDWARWADLVLVAPATANTLAKLAAGEAEDMLTTMVVATGAPLAIAPAMNPYMYGSATTQEALERLAGRGAVIVEPTEGDVACGENGQGKFASVSTIVDMAMTILSRRRMLEGKRVLITSGPTQEPLDDVRFLTNRSSGKMGSALVQAALWMGAEVTVVSGPQRTALPSGAMVIRVETAEEMKAACLGVAGEFDLAIGAAAVADYRPAQRIAGKRRRSADSISVEFVPNPDVIAAIAASGKVARVVGFAAEPTGDTTEARAKLERKGLFAIAVNDVSRTDIGFDADKNELTVLFTDGRQFESGRRTKLGCALWLLETIAP